MQKNLFTKWFNFRWYLGVIVLFAFGYGWLVQRGTDFTNDDLDNFLLMRRTGFWEFLRTPTDVHHVPLHRLLSWLVYHVAPMNFLFVTLVMVGFHLATTWYLFKTIRLFLDEFFAGMLACCYAMSFGIVFGMIWWAHAQHRMPYVFLDVFAIFQYITWLRERRLRQILLASMAFVIAFGFYEKAIFIPVHMLVVGYIACAHDFKKNAWRSLWPILILGTVSLSYVAIYLSMNAAAIQTPLMMAARADLKFIGYLSSAASSILLDPSMSGGYFGIYWRNWAVGAFWLLLIAFSFFRARPTILIWFALFIILFIDYAPISISNRIIFMEDLPHQYRFGYEDLAIVFLFIGLVLSRMIDNDSSDRIALRYGMTCIAIFFAVMNLISLKVAESRNFDLNFYRLSHDYMHHLRNDLARIDHASPVFMDGPIPDYLSVFHIIHDTKELVPLFVPGASFDGGGRGAYLVRLDGHVVQADATAAQAAKITP